MFQVLYFAWNKLANIGMREGMREVEQVKAQIFNYLVLAVLFVQLPLVFRELFSGDYVGSAIISSFFCFSIVLLLMHHYLGLELTSGIYNLFFPTIMTMYLILIGTGDGVQYSFFVFMLTAIIFPSKRNVQIAFIIYNISLFIAGTYWVEQFGPLLDRGAEEQGDAVVIFVAAAICFAVVMYMYNAALERYDQATMTLIDSLQNKNSSLAVMNEELERFTYIASHDLKTPLRNIVSFLSLIEKRIRENRMDEINEYFSVVKDNAHGMYELIEETLEYSKLGQNEWKEEEIDLDLVVDKIKDQLSLGDINVVIEKNPLPIIKGDAFYIYKLFFNLIENGIKYNKKSTKKIQVNTQVNNFYVLISIADNGIGIEEKYYQKIFEMYKRLHTQDDYQGTGIGLSMCKKIVEMMNGKIWLESIPGTGTTFFIELPVVKGFPTGDTSADFIQ